AHNVYLRGKDLPNELLGNVSFSHTIFLAITGREPNANELRLFDGVLISLIDHGLTPSAVIARVTYSTAPRAIQGAVAAGLLNAGEVTLGSMEECGKILYELVLASSSGKGITEVIREWLPSYLEKERRIPGFGHRVHKDGDPRAKRLLEI